MKTTRLKELRKLLNRTQSEVAKVLNISRAAYSTYEIGKREPDHNTLKKMANYFNVSIDYLLENETSPEQTEEVEKWIKVFNEVGITEEQLKNLTQKQKESIIAIIDNFTDSNGKS